MQEATNDVHNGFAAGRVPRTSSKDKLVVANYALHSLEDIDEDSRETLKDMKQVAAREYQITMCT